LDNSIANLMGLYNLNILSLSRNGITNIPSDIKKLVNLKRLILFYNPISITEQKKISTLLPRCKIEF
jgi:Leucine-rich repeat (LRR) protein